MNKEFDAQPARQLGGDELESWFHCPHCGTHEVSLERTCHNSSCLEYAYAKTVHEGWKSRAALAPAAVVMPERRTDANYPAQLWREAAGWNAALDEVARLNRRAIPVELLKRALYHLELSYGDMPTIRELRAMLGNVE